MKPTKSILDPTFQYTNSAKTDLRVRFAEIRREQEQAKAAADEARAEVSRRYQNAPRLHKVPR